MMTTLHGLVTISEFFAGFNLINTGVVNCLIMCQNARKMHHPEAKNPKMFREGVQPPPQTPPFGACGASILPPSALDLAPTRKSWIRQCIIRLRFPTINHLNDRSTIAQIFQKYQIQPKTYCKHCAHIYFFSTIC